MSMTTYVLCGYVAVLIIIQSFFMARLRRLIREFSKPTETTTRQLCDLMDSPLPQPDDGWHKDRLHEMILFSWDAPKEMAEEATADQLYEVVLARSNAQIAIGEYYDCNNWWASGTALRSTVIRLSQDGGQFGQRVATRLAAAVQYAASARIDVLKDARSDMLEALGDHII